MPRDVPSLPPRRPPQPREREPAKPAGRSQRPGRGKPTGPPLLLFVGGAVALAAVVAGAAYAVRQFGGGGFAGVSAPALPGLLSDNPSAVIGDFVGALNDTQAALASVTDESSREAAYTKFAAIGERLVELQRRAMLIDPISEEELRADADRYEGALKLDGFEGQAQRLKDAGLLDERLTGALREIGPLLNSTLGAIRTGMVVPPEPRDEFETLARDRVLLERESARSLARVEDRVDIATAVGDLKGLVPRFDELIRRKQALPQGTGSVAVAAQGRYLKYSTSTRTATLIQVIEAKFGPQPELAQAVVDVSTASSKYEFAVAGSEGSEQWNPAGEGSRSGPTEAVGGTMQPPAGPHGVAYSGRPGPPAGGGPSALPQAPHVAGPGQILVVVSGGALAPADGLNGEEFFAAVEKRREAQQEVSRRLLALGMTRTNNVIRGGAAHVSGAYNGDVQAFADRIDWGTVTEVDAEKRTITVRMAE